MLDETGYQRFIPSQRLGISLSLSADGSMVAFTSDASGQLNLWTQPVSGGPARQLTAYTDQTVREMAWAPDGSIIAFTADSHGDEQHQVYVIAADGSGRATMCSSGTGQHHLAEKSPFDQTGRFLLYSGKDPDGDAGCSIVYDLPAGTYCRFRGSPAAWDSRSRSPRMGSSC
jgi:Tol biopolymer transport system component